MNTPFVFTVIYFTSCGFLYYVSPLFLVEVDFVVGTVLCGAVFVFWSFGKLILVVFCGSFVCCRVPLGLLYKRK